MGKLIHITLLALILISAFFLRFYGTGNMELLGDEYTDFSIAVTLKNNPNPFDSNYKYEDIYLDQTRFSYYLTAFLLSWKFNIIGSRILSVIFGTLTVLLVYLIGKELFNETAGVISAALIAFSVYHIAFSRLAMTSGDSIFLFFYMASMYAFFIGLKYSKNFYIFLSAVLTGISIATKLFGLFLFPIYLLTLWFYRKKIIFRAKSNRLLNILYFSLVPASIYVMISILPAHLSNFKLYLYFISILFIAIYTTILLCSKTRFMDIFVPIHFLVLATLYTFTFTPIHLSPANFLGVFGWFSEWNLSPLATAPYYENFMILFIKLGIIFSIIFLLSLANFFRKAKSIQCTYLMLFFLVPMLALTAIKWKVTWHLMIIFPIVYLIIGKYLNDIFHRIKKQKSLYFISLPFFLFFLFLPLYNMQNIYPYYELQGYQYGDSSIGYNKAAFLSFEGIRAASNYIEQNTEENATVVIYLFDLRYTFYGYSFTNFMYYPKKNPGRYILVESKEELANGNYDYVLLHFYSKKSAAIPKTCILNKTFSIDTIEAFYLYKC